MRLALGYVPLLDAAPLIVAVEGGFTAAEGLAADLVREPSWATLRDKLALGHLDGAHMLAPLALASALGISGPETDLAIPLGLSLNGNAVTVSRALWAAMAAESREIETQEVESQEIESQEIDGAHRDFADLDSVARAFARVARARAGEGRPLTLGTVHPFSSHTYQLRLFAARGGLDLDAATRMVVIPPPWIAEALRTGQIDGFCAGSPWNSVAVAQGYGRIAAFGCDLAPDCPEKVLALPGYAAAGSAPLVRAVRRAGRWCADPENQRELASLLAQPRHLGIDPALIGSGARRRRGGRSRRDRAVGAPLRGVRRGGRAAGARPGRLAPGADGRGGPDRPDAGPRRARPRDLPAGPVRGRARDVTAHRNRPAAAHTGRLPADCAVRKVARGQADLARGDTANGLPTERVSPGPAARRVRHF